MSYIKIPWTDVMQKDIDECCEMQKQRKSKECEFCSCNGGNLECLGEYAHQNDD